MPWPAKLFLAEGHAVGALVNGRIGLVGAYQDFVQRAVVCVLAMVSALRNGAFNALVYIAVHMLSSFCLGYAQYAPGKAFYAKF